MRSTSADDIIKVVQDDKLRALAELVTETAALVKTAIDLLRLSTDPTVTLMDVQKNLGSIRDALVQR